MATICLESAEALGEGPSCLFQLLGAPGIQDLWLPPSHVCLHLHMAYPLCLCRPSSYHIFIYLVFLGPHMSHMVVPRLGVKLELQLLAYATATAMWDPSCICDLHHNSLQLWMINPLNEAWDQTLILMDTSRVHYL